MLQLVKTNLQTKKIWVKKFVHTRAAFRAWLNNQPNKHDIRNLKYRMSASNSSVLGIEYEEVERVVNRNDHDWMSFIKRNSNGLAKLGQKLFQNSIESYVYCVLGAQAQTRWPIILQGAKSLQTQDIFHILVQNTIAQDDQV